MSEPPLTALRHQVASSDGRTIEEIARRLDLVREIGQLKVAHGLPLRDYSLEGEVVERWVRGLAGAGVGRDRAEALARWMVEEAVAAQEALTAREARSSLRGQEALVVGGLGRMGVWLSEYLETAACRVTVVDPGKPPEGFPRPVHARLGRLASDADLIVVATPMRHGPSVFRELLASETEATIFDIFSVKAPVVPLLRRGVGDGYRMASCHPLFGPSTRSLFGRNLLVLDCGDPAAADRVAGLFARSSVRVTRLPLEAHDRLMTNVLGLPHLMSLLFARVLEASGLPPSELARGATTSFRRIADVARLVTEENPELVADIQMLNPGTTDLFARLETSLAELKETVARGAPPGYARVLTHGRSYLAGTAP